MKHSIGAWKQPKPRHPHRRVDAARAGAIWLTILTLQTAAAGPAGAGCALTPMGSATVAAVRDGRTLVLADGRELRLGGIELTDSAADLLRTLSAGQTLRLERLGAGSDRYGRLVAFAYLPEASQSLQQVLVEAGQAVVSGRVGDRACAEALLAAERRARQARRGNWAKAASGADPNFAALSSKDLTKLEAARGHFTRVEGKVLSVRESGPTIYVNFGSRWIRDFTVIVPKRQQSEFAAAGIDLKQLGGHRIRVRGWMEQRGGPAIEAAEPGQIELIE